jgi:phenylacetate-CoA ligase
VGCVPVDVAALARDIAAAMHQRLSVRPEVEIVDCGSIERTSHKTKLIEIATEATT